MMKLKEPASTRHCLISRDPTSHAYLFTLTTRNPEVRGGFSVRFFDGLPDRVEPTGDHNTALAYWSRLAERLNINPDALRTCYDLTGDALGGESTDPQPTRPEPPFEVRHTYQRLPIPPVPPDVCIPGCVRDDPHARARCIVPAPPLLYSDEYITARALPSNASRRSDMMDELSKVYRAECARQVDGPVSAHGQRIVMLETTIATITEANRVQCERLCALENELAESRWELAESRKSSETQIAALEASLTIQRDAVANREREIEALEACNAVQAERIAKVNRFLHVGERFDRSAAADAPGYGRDRVIHVQSQVDPDE